MKFIIIPTDFSPAASNAMNYGIKLAKDIEAAIILFHSFQIPLTATEASVMMTEASIDQMKKDAEDSLNSLKEKIEKEHTGTLKVFTQLRIGNTVNELETFSKEFKPFAIVMGSTGHSAIGRVLFGSTTLLAMRHLNSPIIAVPPGTEYKSIKKIGLACDLKHVTGSMPASFIKEIANTLHAELHVLHVDHLNPKYDPEKNEEIYRMQTLFGDIKLSYHFIDHTDMEEGINEFARDNDLDLVVTIPKKHGLLESIFHKSASKQILFRSKIPVMSIHEP
ncbi:MAG: universal stress protein [Chitinophagaceae bacterium]|nr:universal stress protein [Chitinophagaceae bacterium]